MSLRQKYRQILSGAIPAGAVGSLGIARFSTVEFGARASGEPATFGHDDGLRTASRDSGGGVGRLEGGDHHKARGRRASPGLGELVAELGLGPAPLGLAKLEQLA